MKILVFIFSSVFTSAYSQASSFRPVTVPLEGEDKILVRGYKGTLEVYSHSAHELRIVGKKESSGPFNQWNFQVRKKNNQIEVVVKGPSGIEDWEKIRSGSIPTFHLKIYAPKRALDISWSQGNVELDQWTAPVKIHMTRGKIKSQKGAGEFSAQLIQGEIQVNQHKGNIHLQTYKGKVFLVKTEGSLKVDNHSARLNLSEHEGPVDVRNHSGQMVAKKISGNLHLNNVSGVFSLNDISGSLQGQSQKGAIHVQASSLQNFSLNVDSTPVTLKLPKNSGAMVSMRSERGSLRGPGHLRKIKKGRWTELRGRLRGKEQGEIKIVSKYGNIVLK